MMPVGGNWYDFSSRPKRCNSEAALNESWRHFYDLDGDSVGRKNSVPANLSNGQFASNFEFINEFPYDKSLAVKIIRRFRGGRDTIEKIRNEINLIKRLRPPTNNENVPRTVAPLLYSVHEDGTQVAIVMEFAHGGSLYDLVYSEIFSRSLLPVGDIQSAPQPRIPESYISSVLYRVTDALAFMHDQANIVHLDIKAENILLREPYPSSDVFITDFGLASYLSSTKPHKELAGTPDYTAPEVISYDPVSFATDMWSVGVLAYFLLTGKSPFLAESKALTLSNITQMKIDYPPDLFNSVSPSALAFIRALIQRNPRARLTASQCRQHEWLSWQAEKENQGEIVKEEEKKEMKIEEIGEVLKEDVSVVPSSGEDESSSSDSSSSISSPSRKRIALDDSENLEALTQVTSKSPSPGVIPTPVSAIDTPLPSGCCAGLLAPRSVFSLEGGGVAKHHHHHSRRRSVLASISPPPTLTEAASPVE
nr:serine:threonine protein kinase 17A [Hymenolepis microstoma]